MKAIWLFLLIYFLSFQAKAQESNVITIGERYAMQSEVLDEERHYLVYLPASYNDSTLVQKHYPVMYLLDGGAHFHSASGVVQFMSTGINGNIQIPELIIVAITNTDRTRDLTPTHTTLVDGNEETFLKSSGGGNNFLKFLMDELIPHIESDYRTKPFRILVGHSFGGLFALHTLMEQPGLFQAMIAIDPSTWWDEQILVKRIREKRRGKENLRGHVFITLANNPDGGDGDPKELEISARTFAANLARMHSESLRSDMKYYDSEDHGSVPLMSLYDGLLFIFDGLQTQV